MGEIYVGEIFAGRVSRIGSDGLPTTVVELPTPSGLEYDHGLLYVSYNVFENGSIATIDVGRY